MNRLVGPRRVGYTEGVELALLGFVIAAVLIDLYVRRERREERDRDGLSTTDKIIVDLRNRR